MATITLRQASRLGGHKRPWVARINGKDAQFGLSRTFVEADKTVFGGEWTYELLDGLYECCTRNSKGAERRYFALVAEGVTQECVSDEVVQEWLGALEVQQAIRAEESARIKAEREASARKNSRELTDSDPIENAKAATLLVVDKVPTGTVKEDFLPYVRAALTYWGRVQQKALDDDNTRASFQAAEQQIKFFREFEKLTGRKFDLATDAATLEEIESL